MKQKAKLVEWNAEYVIFDRHERRIGAVGEVGGGPWRMAGRHKLEVTDAEGWIVLTLESRPTNVIFPTMTVNDGKGVPVGRIRLKTFGFFAGAWLVLEADGRELGAIRVKRELEAPTSELALEATIVNETGARVGHITKSPAGRLKEWFTKADNYVMEFEPTLHAPLRSLVIAAPIFIDLVFVQESDRTAHRRMKPRWLSGDEC
jgi:uncharacterized protein YxjI